MPSTPQNGILKKESMRVYTIAHPATIESGHDHHNNRTDKQQKPHAEYVKTSHDTHAPKGRTYIPHRHPPSATPTTTIRNLRDS